MIQMAHERGFFLAADLAERALLMSGPLTYGRVVLPLLR